MIFSLKTNKNLKKSLKWIWDSFTFLLLQFRGKFDGLTIEDAPIFGRVRFTRRVFFHKNFPFQDAVWNWNQNSWDWFFPLNLKVRQFLIEKYRDQKLNAKNVYQVEWYSSEWYYCKSVLSKLFSPQHTFCLETTDKYNSCTTLNFFRNYFCLGPKTFG